MGPGDRGPGTGLWAGPGGPLSHTHSSSFPNPGGREPGPRCEQGRVVLRPLSSLCQWLSPCVCLCPYRLLIRTQSQWLRAPASRPWGRGPQHANLGDTVQPSAGLVSTGKPGRIARGRWPGVGTRAAPTSAQRGWGAWSRALGGRRSAAPPGGLEGAGWVGAPQGSGLRVPVVHVCAVSQCVSDQVAGRSVWALRGTPSWSTPGPRLHLAMPGC